MSGRWNVSEMVCQGDPSDRVRGNQGERMSVECRHVRERERVIGIGSEGCQERGCQGEGM